MFEIINEINNRERIHLIIGLILIITLFVLPKTRKTIITPLKSISKIIFNLSIFPIIYYTLITIAFTKLPFWETGFLKYIIFEIIYCIITTILLGSKQDINKKDFIKNCFNIGFLFTFFIGSYTLNINLELLFFIIIIIYNLLQMVCYAGTKQGTEQEKNRYKKISKFLEKIMTFVCVCFLTKLCIVIYNNLDDVIKMRFWIIYLIPSIYSLFILPLYYIRSYIDIFKLLSDYKSNKIITKWFKIFIACKFNIKKIITVRFDCKRIFASKDENDFKELLKNLKSYKDDSK